MKTKFVMLVLAMCFEICYRQAHAVPITIEVEGTVTSISGTGIPVTIYEGVSFTGAYTYDSETMDSDSANVKYGAYWHDSPFGMSISLGGYEFKTDPSHTGGFLIYIDDLAFANRDYYGVKSYDNIAQPSDIFIQEISWVLGDTTQTALSSDLLPTSAPLLTDWDYNVFKIVGENNSFTINGVITEAVIPEPLTITFMAIGAFISLRKRPLS